MKLLSFCNVWRVKRSPGRDLSIAALPVGYLVKNGVRHACRTAVSGNLCRVRATLVARRISGLQCPDIQQYGTDLLLRVWRATLADWLDWHFGQSRLYYRLSLLSKCDMTVNTITSCLLGFL